MRRKVVSLLYFVVSENIRVDVVVSLCHAHAAREPCAERSVCAVLFRHRWFFNKLYKIKKKRALPSVRLYLLLDVWS